MKASCISLLTVLCISANTFRFVTGANSNAQRLRQGRRDVEDSTSPGIECFVAEVYGITPPSSAHLPPRLMCEDSSGVNYMLDGDTDSFFKDKDTAAGHLKLSVPSSAVSGYSIVMGSGLNITAAYDNRRLQERKLQNTGEKKVLIVRINDASESNDGRRVRKSAYELSQDVFHDENNLAEVYRKCSNQQLTFVPSPSFSYGVLQYSLSADTYCGKNWWEVTNDLRVELNINNYDADYMMFVMADCVDFEGAAGWGQTPGHQTWYPSAYASMPVVQVHEMGHNFGHSHSGKNGLSYGDDTGYMGNQADWTDEGSAMCFNAAKMWYFNWYQLFQKSVYVSTAAYNTNMVGVGRASSAVNGNDKIVVKVSKETGTSNANLFILFNSAVGSNSGVKGDANKIVITAQNTQYSESTWKAALGGSETYTHYNWGSSGQTLVIKNCGLDWSYPVRATLVVAFQGHSSLSCNFDQDIVDVEDPEPPPAEDEYTPPETINMPSKIDDTKYFVHSADLQLAGYANAIRGQRCENIPGWYDGDGDEYNCNWYADHPESCHKSHPNMEHTPGTACCACGGGLGVYLYDPEQCQDTDGWQDRHGKDCAWYEKDTAHCLSLSLKFSNMGQTASQACCYCKEQFGMFDR